MGMKVFENEQWIVTIDNTSNAITITHFEHGHWDGEVRLDSDTFQEVEVLLGKRK